MKNITILGKTIVFRQLFENLGVLLFRIWSHCLQFSFEPPTRDKQKGRSRVGDSDDCAGQKHVSGSFRRGTFSCGLQTSTVNSKNAIVV